MQARQGDYGTTLTNLQVRGKQGQALAALQQAGLQPQRRQWQRPALVVALQQQVLADQAQLQPGYPAIPGQPTLDNCLARCLERQRFCQQRLPARQLRQIGKLGANIDIAAVIFRHQRVAQSISQNQHLGPIHRGQLSPELAPGAIPRQRQVQGQLFLLPRRACQLQGVGHQCYPLDVQQHGLQPGSGSATAATQALQPETAIRAQFPRQQQVLQAQATEPQ